MSNLLGGYKFGRAEIKVVRAEDAQDQQSLKFSRAIQLYLIHNAKHWTFEKLEGIQDNSL